jgi:glycosyltransferase involved in cell wall biosynthesis
MSNWRKNIFTHAVGTLINHYLRVIDYKVAQEVGVFIANSAETARRIKKFYRRDSTIVYPPVLVPEAAPQSTERSYYLYVNRLALAKHPELAVQACTQLNAPLKVVGTGKMLEDLKSMAGPTIEFMGAVPDEELNQLYSGAKGLLYPVEDEDFGMVPIEAMAHGVPVIAHESGGPKETIIEEKTGLFFQELSVSGLVEAMLLAERYSFEPKTLHKHATQFDLAHFQAGIRKVIDSAIRGRD